MRNWLSLGLTNRLWASARCLPIADSILARIFFIQMFIEIASFFVFTFVAVNEKKNIIIFQGLRSK